MSPVRNRGRVIKNMIYTQRSKIVRNTIERGMFFVSASYF